MNSLTYLDCCRHELYEGHLFVFIYVHTNTDTRRFVWCDAIVNDMSVKLKDSW